MKRRKYQWTNMPSQTAGPARKTGRPVRRRPFTQRAAAPIASSAVGASRSSRSRSSPETASAAGTNSSEIGRSSV
ncbi:hypothetical protein ACWGB8_08420 [Kitasatospora sp. NPDC054939]